MKISLVFLMMMLICACGSDSRHSVDSNQAGISEEAIGSQMKSGTKTDETQQGTRLISESSVGMFSKGDLIDLTSSEGVFSLSKRANKTRDNNLKEFYSFGTVSEELIRLIPAYDHRNKVYTKLIGEIQVKSKIYRDIKGVGVGSTLSDFKKAYPKAYAYYDCAADKLLMSNQGSGPQYIVSADAISEGEGIQLGRVDMSRINSLSKIEMVKLVRSKVENEEAKINKDMEEQEILEKYLESVTGNYYPKGYSEKYYKIHKKQGEYYVSECFEDECNRKGKIIQSEKSANGYVSLKLDGVSGQMVPSWSVKKISDVELHLNVYDYDGINDKWSNVLFIHKAN